jgi:hypothetical protein
MAKSGRSKRHVATVPTQSNRPAERLANVGHDYIARRAYQLYVSRCCEDGHELDDWLQAERELRQLQILLARNGSC